MTDPTKARELAREIREAFEKTSERWVVAYLRHSDRPCEIRSPNTTPAVIAEYMNEFESQFCVAVHNSAPAIAAAMESLADECERKDAEMERLKAAIREIEELHRGMSGFVTFHGDGMDEDQSTYAHGRMMDRLFKLYAMTKENPNA